MKYKYSISWLNEPAWSLCKCVIITSISLYSSSFSFSFNFSNTVNPQSIIANLSSISTYTELFSLQIQNLFLKMLILVFSCNSPSLIIYLYIFYPVFYYLIFLFVNFKPTSDINTWFIFFHFS